jgi:hypothetical protein
VGAVFMGGVFLFSTLHGGPEPLPPAVSMPPSASADAYLCSSSCADRPMAHDPTVEMARHFGPPIVIGPTPPPMPAIVIGPLPVPAQPKAAAQSSPKAQKQAGSKGAKGKSSSGKAQKAPKAPKQPKAAKTTPAPAAATLPATVPQ